ncbi:MAG: glycosyltransferase family 4 protein [Candidatus Omnitrophica bacterium]|nr:glycosyltransferase family 4 protein [Candidatus Omnitrophota bacterium]
MKICLEAQSLNHTRRSGLMTYTEGLINSLYHQNKTDDYTLAYFSLKRKVADMPGPTGNGFHKNVLKVPDWDFPLHTKILNSIILPRFLRDNKIDVFHRPSGYNMPESRKVFKVLTVHDLRTLTIGDKKWTQNIDHYHATLNKLDVCVVVSECTKRDLLEHFHIDEKKIKVAYLAADERFRRSSDQAIAAIREKYNLHEKFFLSVGSVPRKNIEGIIRGFAGAKVRNDYILILSCNQDIEKYTQWAESLNISSRVRILQQLSDQDMVDLYSACHCFLFPSLYEGFGLPIVEAMQCGAPVITSNRSSCPEVAGDAALLVDPRNVNEISEAVDQMGTNESLREEFIRRGSIRCKQFHWKNYGIEMKKIYDLA